MIYDMVFICSAAEIRLFLQWSSKGNETEMTKRSLSTRAQRCRLGVIRAIARRFDPEVALFVMEKTDKLDKVDSYLP